jgi:GT2 family glycosyltransferase
LVGVDGNTQSSVRGFPTAIALFGEITGLGRRWPRSPLGAYRLIDFDYERQQPGPQPMGTFLLFRREALEAVGSASAPFDPAFPIFFNEVDLLYRLDRAGWPCLYSPAAWVRHHGGESTKQVRKSMIWESHRSLLRYLWKHHGRGFGAVGLWGLSIAVLAAAWIRARGYDAGFRIERHHM